MKTATDVCGLTFVVGDLVAVAAKYYLVDGLHVEVKQVTKVDGDKVYLNDSRQPLRFPERVAILGR